MIIDIESDKYLPTGRYVLYNSDKIERAKNSLSSNSNERDILIEYDKIGGLIFKDGRKLTPQTLWNMKKQKEAESVENLSDDEIDDILRSAENTNVPGSRYQKAKIESEIRHRKRMEKSTQEPKVSIGILNRGRNNRFINNTFEGPGVGIQDEGENTFARGNKFIEVRNDIKNFSAKHPWWFAIITGSILIIMSYIAKLLLGF